MDRGDAARLVVKRARQDDADDAAAVFGDRAEQEVHGAVAVQVARVVDQLAEAPRRRGEVFRGLADVAAAALEALALPGDDHRQGGRARQHVPEVAVAVERPVEDDEHDGVEVWRERRQDRLDILQSGHARSTDGDEPGQA